MSRSTITLFYGTEQVTNSAVLDAVANAIDNHQNLPVKNDKLGGDPTPDVPKYAVIYYALKSGGQIRAKIALEGEPLTFATDIESIWYGGKQVKDQKVFSNIFTAFINSGSYKVTNDSMGGDPDPGVAKKATVNYLRDGKWASVTVEEHGEFNF